CGRLTNTGPPASRIFAPPPVIPPTPNASASTSPTNNAAWESRIGCCGGRGKLPPFRGHSSSLPLVGKVGEGGELLARLHPSPSPSSSRGGERSDRRSRRFHKSPLTNLHSLCTSISPVTRGPVTLAIRVGPTIRSASLLPMGSSATRWSCK